MRPALFLDRDGIINEDIGWLHKWEDVRFVDGIVPVIAAANELGYVTCVITNQAGIGRGYYSEADFHALMSRMRFELLALGARLDAVYFSPFHPEHGIGDYKRDTDCRKPGPGMLLQARHEHGIELSHSLLIGDRCSDVEAGAAAGIPSRNLFLYRPMDPLPCTESVAYTVLTALRDVIEVLRAHACQP